MGLNHHLSPSKRAQPCFYYPLLLTVINFNNFGILEDRIAITLNDEIFHNKLNVLQVSLLSNTGWAVRQPPYKSGGCVTARPVTWAGLLRSGRHELVDPHRLPVLDPEEQFGLFPTGSALPPHWCGHNGHTAHGHMPAEERPAALRQRGEATK